MNVLSISILFLFFISDTYTLLICTEYESFEGYKVYWYKLSLLSCFIQIHKCVLHTQLKILKCTLMCCNL